MYRSFGWSAFDAPRLAVNHFIFKGQMIAKQILLPLAALLSVSGCMVPARPMYVHTVQPQPVVVQSQPMVAQPMQPQPMGPPPVGAPPPVVGFEELQDPTEQSVQINWGLADGRPVRFSPGEAMAVWIWQDARGTEWHLRTSTARTQHRFVGTIVGEQAPFTSVEMVRTEMRDRVRVNRNRLTFDFQTDGSADGLDFRIAGNQCVRFYVKADGRPMPPSRIFIGRNGQNPQFAHFKLCP